MATQKNNLTISSIRYPVRYWRYLLLFQSWSQLQSWIIIVLATALLSKWGMDFLNPSVLPTEGLFAGVVTGSLFSVLMVLPAEFDVFASPDQSMKLLSSQLEGMGYLEVSTEGDSLIYRPNLPRVLRWDEGNVVIRKCEKKITVSGGVAILLNIRRFY